jgi:phospholipid/cholesterol/gamma-HCH transport system substrate-binding protein
MNKNYFEIIVGFLVVAITIIFFLSARNTADVGVSSSESYQLQAKFLRIDGVEVGSDVRIAGIKVGSVAYVGLDSISYEAVIKISVLNQYKIPVDSYISIISSGLLGGKYVDIEPGISDEVLNNGETLTYTRSSVSIESLLSKFLFKK